MNAAVVITVAVFLLAVTALSPFTQTATGAEAVASGPTAMVTGTVTDEATGEPIWALISLNEYRDYADDWFSVGEPATPTDGHYELGDPSSEPKQYRVFAHNPRYYVGVRDITWTGESTIKVDFALRELPVLVSGTAVNGKTGEPVPYLWVWLKDDTGEHVHDGTTEQDGSFSIRATEGMHPGNYTISGFRFGIGWFAQRFYWDGITPVIQTATVEEKWLASGRVTNNAGAPIANARVESYVYDSRSEEYRLESSTVTGSDGTYQLGAPPHTDFGEHDIHVRAYGYEPQYETVHWETTEPVTVNFTMEAYSPFTNVAGKNRYETSIAGSVLAYPEGLDTDGSGTVVIATGRNWPDALGGAALAGAVDGPILLADGDSLTPALNSELNRLGARKVIILGGTTAISPKLQQAFVSKLGAENVKRIAGADRYETANKTALEAIRLLEEDSFFGGDAFVATGGNFADALAAAPLSAGAGIPLFLVDPRTGISVETRNAMSKVERVIILGGSSAVSGKAEWDLLTRFARRDISRIAGADRYKTAVAIAKLAVDEWGFQWDGVGIATGTNFPDALSGGVVQGRMGGVMLLTRSGALEPAVEEVIKQNSDDIWTVTYYGDVGAVSTAVRDRIAAIRQ